VPVAESAVVGDYIPADLDPGGLPSSYARLVSSYTTTERNEGAARARAAIEQFAGPPGESPAGGSAAGESPAADVHELIVTHNFLIGLVHQARAGRTGLALDRPEPAELRADRDLVPARPAAVAGHLQRRRPPAGPAALDRVPGPAPAPVQLDIFP
jgi:hypothetical protein